MMKENQSGNDFSRSHFEDIIRQKGSQNNFQSSKFSNPSNLNISIQPQINSSLNNHHEVSTVNKSYAPRSLDRSSINHQEGKNTHSKFKEEKPRKNYKIIVNAEFKPKTLSPENVERNGYIKRIFMEITSPKPKVLEDDEDEFDQCEYSLASFKQRRNEEDKKREMMRRNIQVRYKINKNNGEINSDTEFEMDNRSFLTKLMKDDTGILAGIGIKKIPTSK